LRLPGPEAQGNSGSKPSLEVSQKCQAESRHARARGRSTSWGGRLNPPATREIVTLLSTHLQRPTGTYRARDGPPMFLTETTIARIGDRSRGRVPSARAGREDEWYDRISSRPAGFMIAGRLVRSSAPRGRLASYVTVTLIASFCLFYVLDLDNPSFFA